MSPSASTQIARYSALVEAYLSAHMPTADCRPARLHEAMRYAVLAGGKRIRPALCIAAAESFGTLPEDALRSACALELLHTYTLVHDDLPAMDDDDLRRGRPTLHKAFDEATAILAGDALLTLAFEWVAQPAPPPYRPTALVLELAGASGSLGVIGGQMEDILAEGKSHDAATLEYVHTHKTGALIRASVRIGGIIAGATESQLAALTRYGEATGLAFQIVDDLLNVTGDAVKMGKATGTDAERGKLTYVAVHGIDRARSKAHALIQEAVSSIQPLTGDKEGLTQLAHLIGDRLH